MKNTIKALALFMFLSTGGYALDIFDPLFLCINKCFDDDNLDFLERFTNQPLSSLYPLLRDPHKGHEVTPGSLREVLAAHSYFGGLLKRSDSVGDFMVNNAIWDIKTPIFPQCSKRIGADCAQYKCVGMAQEIIKHANYNCPIDISLESFFANDQEEPVMVYDEQDLCKKNILVDVTYLAPWEILLLKKVLSRTSGYNEAKDRIKFVSYKRKLRNSLEAVS